MSFIEGIGDDFLYAFGFLLFTGIVSLAWLSTHVNHINFPTTLFIIERRARRRNDEESDRTSATPPSRSTPPNEQATSPSSGNETQTEHETDNESSGDDEFPPEAISTVTEPPNLQVPEQPSCDQITHEQLATSEDPQSLRLIIKFLNDTRKEVLANPNDTISKVKELNFADELANHKMIRFIYQGRELQDHETLRTYNIRDQTIIHCQISNRRLEPTTPRTGGNPSGPHINRNTFDASAFIDASPVNISSHFVLLVSLVLGFIWYLRIKYRGLFSPISTIVLILITIIFLIFTCGPLLTTRRVIPNATHTTVAVTPIQHVHLD